MTTMKHMCMDLRGAIRNRVFYGFTKDDGTELSRGEAMQFILDQIAMGRKVIPLGECDNFDYQEGCLGHPVKDGE